VPSGQMRIKAYCLRWNLDHSLALRRTFAEPLRPYMCIDLTPWEEEEQSVLSETSRKAGHPVVFCQVVPPLELVAQADVHAVWIPMWDQAWAYPQAWWDRLPKSLRIIAFSQAVADRSEKAGLQTLSLRYYMDPNRIPHVSWPSARVLMYWNRTGLIGPKFLERLCSELEVDTLLFRSQIDPLMPREAAYSLPSRLGRTTVQEAPDPMDADQYLGLLAQASVFIAPRKREGVGLTFLEAMASGCAVLACDGPTMNEYIRHRHNGFLFRARAHHRSRRDLHHAFQYWLSRFGLGRPPGFRFALSEDQAWDEIRALDLPALGRAARHDHEEGYREWQRRIPEYARFMLDW